MMTISDFINLLLHYYPEKDKPDSAKILGERKVEACRGPSSILFLF